MAPKRNTKRQKLIEQEGRIEFAIQALKNHNITSIRKAAELFGVPRVTLPERLNGAIHRPIARANIHKLTGNEEQSLIQWILSMDERGQAPQRIMVQQMANLLLAKLGDRNIITVGKNWVTNFVTRTKCLKTRYSRRYNNQRALCEGPKVIKP